MLQTVIFYHSMQGRVYKEDLADFLDQIMYDEFQSSVEDGSLDNIAWRIVVMSDDIYAGRIDKLQHFLSKAPIIHSTVVISDDSGGEHEDGMMENDEAPDLVPAVAAMEIEPKPDTKPKKFIDEVIFISVLNLCRSIVVLVYVSVVNLNVL